MSTPPRPAGLRRDDPPGTVAGLPVLVHVPHAATWIPPAERAAFVVDDRELDDELRVLTDHHTDRLTDGVVELGATRIVNLVSRLVVDPERLPDDREELAARGMGALYSHGSRGQRLRRLTRDHAERLLTELHAPYAATVAAAVTDLLARHGQVTLVDVHSYPTRRLPYELHDGPRPPLCIGTDGFHTPTWLHRLVAEVADENTIATACDTPFAGCYVPLDRLGTDRRVRAVMLELRRDLYLDERTATVDEDGAARVRRLVLEVVRRAGGAGP